MPTSTNLPPIAEHLQLGQDVTLTGDQCDRQLELKLRERVAGGQGDRAVRQVRWYAILTARVGRKQTLTAQAWPD
jgi:hypothetical protein